MEAGSVAIVVAIVGAAAATVAAILSFVAARRSLAHAELRELRRRVEITEQRNIKLWNYCLKLRDHIYRELGPPPPPPDDLEDLFGPTE